MHDKVTALKRFLFIYQVQNIEGCTSYVSVVTLGRSLQQAELIAINQVHQQGLHILRTDTATEASWLNPLQDGPMLGDLARYGVAVREIAA